VKIALTPFQKELNIKLGKSNLFLMCYMLMLPGRKGNQTKEKKCFPKKRKKENAKTMLDNLSL